MKPENIKYKVKIKDDNKLHKVMDIDFENKEITYEFEFKKGEYINAISYFEDIEELLQWTGFKDKEGNEIYEGDTLTHSGDIEGLLWVCEFDKFKNLRCKGLNKESTTFNMGNSWYMSGGAPFVKVIGNVYEED